MNNFHSRLAILGLLCFTFILCASCKDDEDDAVEENLSIDFVANFGSEKMGFQEEYSVEDGLRIKFSRLMFYVSNITLLGADGSEESVPDVFLINLANPTSISLRVPDGSYTGMRFGIGLDAETNAIDPNTYDSNSPLSESKNMFWSMVKYKFFVVEGRIDDQAMGTELFNSAFSYHIGFDELYKTVSLNKDISTFDGDQTSIDVTLDLEKVFFTGDKPIDIFNNLNSHTTLLPISYDLADNFSKAFE